MTLEEAANELVETRIALDAARAAYEAQRLIVHNALVNAQKKSVSVAGYRIGHTPDSVSRALKLDLLRTALQQHGISEPAALDIITEATLESPRNGILTMVRLPEPDEDEQDA